MRRFLQCGLLIAGLIVCSGAWVALSSTAVYAQARTKRLVLKDGSFQGVTKWEMKGDRVRYFSAERYQWEEMPNSLVDWQATEKYNASLSEPETAPQSQAREVDAEERAEREKEEAATPVVAPGLRLPQSGGVFMLDTYRGEPQLVEMGQSGADVNKQTGKNILHAAINPISTSRQSIELKGAHAPVQSHVAQPEIFANVDQSGTTVDNNGVVSGRVGKDLDQQPDRYRIVRVQSKKDMRVVGSVKIAMTGRVSQEENMIKTVSQRVSGGWVKITPYETLMPGEYALVEMLGPKEMNLYVWDFGVDPSAPQNSSSWKPVQPTPTKTGSNDSPVLNKRPKQ